MKSNELISETVLNEIYSYFRFITRPFDVKEILPTRHLIDLDSKYNNFLGKYFDNRNVSLFLLIGKEWKLYYADIETPILFTLSNNRRIPQSVFSTFFKITQQIKTNLSKFYNQEVETIIIDIEDTGAKINNKLMTFKIEAQTESLKNDSDEIILSNGKKRHPCGQLSPKNKLNTLTGREWYLFTKSWLIHRPPSRTKDEILHPAKFPETLIRKFITFFTKPGEVVLDPFLGTGSTLVAAKQSNRCGVGFELSQEYANISLKRVESIINLPYPPIYYTKNNSYWKIFCRDARELKTVWDIESLPPADFCITSPPYWDQLRRNTIRQKSRVEKGLDTRYGQDPRDIGNIEDYQKFLREQKNIFGQVYEVLKEKGYLVIITNNVFSDGKVFPLAFDTATVLSRGSKHNWVLKDEKLWLQDDKSLIAFGVNNAWVANRCHQYCLVFRKDSSVC